MAYLAGRQLSPFVFDSGFAELKAVEVGRGYIIDLCVEQPGQAQEPLKLSKVADA